MKLVKYFQKIDLSIKEIYQLSEANFSIKFATYDDSQLIYWMIKLIAKIQQTEFGRIYQVKKWMEKDMLY